MRRISVRGLLVAYTGLALGWGCTDQIPTLSDAGALAPGMEPTTIQHLFGPSEVLKSTRVRAGETDADDARYRLVANDFDGSLDAHVLARFRAFPDTISLLEGVDSQFVFINSHVIATIPDSLQTSAPLLDFELWTVAQPWDSLSVSWENAVDSAGAEVPWATPGGTRGQHLGMARWEKDATAGADSLIWEIPYTVVEQLAAGEIPGLMVTLLQPGTRAQISALSVRASIQPANVDTVVTRIVGPGQHEFIFTPDPPQPENVLRVGGITSDRSYLLLDLTEPVPICPESVAICNDFAPAVEVSLNRVELLLDPVPVTGGFRPVAPLEIQVRRVLEPELGEQAPLGAPIGFGLLSIAQAAGSSSEPFSVDLTATVEGLLREGETELAVALLTQEGSSFAYAWFARNPRLRFVYTLPQRPELP